MMKKILILLIIAIVSAGSAISGQSLTIQGRIYDKADGSIIQNAVITLKPDNKVVTSDQNGQYIFTCTPGKKEITTRVLGYRSENIRF
ncbi:MAG TPA: carboxypeptidase-like regulatory domain-containing protein [Bacteroidales bacterium]|nr:carboxypeptidase-like regulatory domain-containing protein [Bacteroidales bacterium]